MSEDRATITNGQYYYLDEIQKEIITTIAKDHEQTENPKNLKTKNLFLWGSRGTGKTLVLTEALSMKVSYYRKKKVNLNVFVTTYDRWKGGK